MYKSWMDKGLKCVTIIKKENTFVNDNHTGCIKKNDNHTGKDVYLLYILRPSSAINGQVCVYL